MSIKSKDIAKELGLSTATVSLALNDRPGVSERTKQKVQNYMLKMEELSFQKKYLLKSESIVEKGTILLLNYYKNGNIMERNKDRSVATSTTSPFEEAAMKKGYQLIAVDYDEKKSSPKELIKIAKEHTLKGIYIIAAEMSKHDIYPFLQLKIPIVVGDCNFYEEQIDSFMIDNREGIKRAVDYLVDKGHSFIVYMAENSTIFNFVERRKAFVREMDKRQCGEVSKRIITLGNSLEDVYESSLKFLNEDSKKPTAFILESSVVSLGVTKALMEKGMRIPRDISLVGFDSLPPESFRGFELTLIKGTHTKRHLAAIFHLIELIEKDEGTLGVDHKETIRLYYKTHLIEGNSVFDKTKYIYTQDKTTR